MALPVLPQDVFDEIISQSITETSTLKSCSLVCHSFRRVAQRMIFNSFVIILDHPIKPTNFVLIVKQAPHLIEYIHDIEIIGSPMYPYSVRSKSIDLLADALGVFSREGKFPINLRSLWLINLTWTQMRPALQDALMLLATVHSLVGITLNHVTDCSPNLLANLPPLLKYLSLTGTQFSSLPTTRKELPRLESFEVCFATRECMDQLAGDTMQHIVNMTELKTFQGHDCNPNSMPVIEQILRPTYNSLKHLIFQFDIKDPDSISLDLNHFRHLTDITMVHFCRITRHLSLVPPTVIWITRTMKNISHRNVIQNLSFRLSFSAQLDAVDFDSAMKNVWQELDIICSIPQLASSNTFRGMTFNIQSTASNCDALSDLVQNRLPETKIANKLCIKTSYFYRTGS